MLKPLKFHIIAISIICLLITGLYQFMGPTPSPRNQPAQLGDRYVRVISASWGLNCNPFIAEAKRTRESVALPKNAQGEVIPQEPLKEMTLDNVLPAAKNLCDAKVSCEIQATSDVLGLEPMSSCFKQLNVNYRCFEQDLLKTTVTNQGELLKINCAIQPASNAPASETPNP